jgi:exonuclease I
MNSSAKAVKIRNDFRYIYQTAQNTLDENEFQEFRDVVKEVLSEEDEDYEYELDNFYDEDEDGEDEDDEEEG